MTCWFCGTKEADSKKSVHLYMYGEMLATDPEENKKRIEYSTKKIEVPRCTDCKKSHAQAQGADVWMIIMLVLMVAAGISAVSSLSAQWIWGMALGFGLGAIILLFILKSFILKGVKKLSSAKKEYPQVEDLLARGYKFGKNPSYEESVQQNGAVAERKNGSVGNNGNNGSDSNSGDTGEM
jgi:hypothetical protein